MPSAMGLMDWLFTVVHIERHLTNTYYIGMAVIVVLALVVAWRTRFIRFGAMLWLTSGLICLGWEVTLWATGIRHYNFTAVLELLYHGFTEAGPGLILMSVVGHYAKIVDLSCFRDPPNSAGQGESTTDEEVC